jgi:two-component system, OmpR family, KDP operon response regulator KdpE
MVLPLTVDLDKRRVFRGAEELHLTGMEYRLLARLCSEPYKFITYREICSAIWEDDPLMFDYPSSIKSLVQRVRRKLGDDGDEYEYVITRYAYGLRVSEAVRIGPIENLSRIQLHDF